MRCCRRCWIRRFGGSCESRNPRKNTKDTKGFRAFRALSRYSCFRLPYTNSSGCAPSNAKPSARRNISSKPCCTERFGGSCESRNSRKNTKDTKGFRAFRALSRYSCFRPFSITVQWPPIRAVAHPAARSGAPGGVSVSNTAAPGVSGGAGLAQAHTTS